MSWQVRGFGCVGLLLVAPSGVIGDPKPPEPDPADPVNYIEWITDTFGDQVKDNAWDLYRRLEKQVETFDGDWQEVLGQPWSDNEAMAGWLSAHRKAFKTFREAAGKPGCFVRLDPLRRTGDARVDDNLLTVALPALKPLRATCKGLLAEGYRAWADGDEQRLPDNAVLALRSGHHLEAGPLLIARLVGISCAALGYDGLLDALHLSDDPDALATRVLPKLNEADPPWPTFESVADAERMFAWDVCQRLFVPGPKKDTWTVYQPLLSALRGAGLGRIDQSTLARIGYDQTLRDADAYYDALREWFTKPYYLAADDLEKLEAMRQATQNPLLRVFLSSLSRVRELHERITATRRATHLIVHLFAVHAEKGRFPRTLAQLDAPDLAQLRIDPFSGRDFVYKRKGDSFTLYSVASDLEDDRGRHDPRWENGDYVFWPAQE